MIKYKNKKAPYQYLLMPENNQSTRTNFYQNFKATACPPKQKYEYNLSDIGCRNYNQSEDALDLKTGARLYGFNETIQELKLYKRAMHEEKPILVKGDVFYRATDGMGGDPAFNLDYRPIAPIYYDQYGKVSELNITNSVLIDEGGVLRRKVDLTGTILGYYAGATDLFYYGSRRG